MRIDRQLTTAFFHPLQRAGKGQGEFRLPILMYHSLSGDPERGVSPYYKTNTDPLIFRRQMAQLAGEGYKTLDLTEVVRLLAADVALPKKAVVVTFDDGFRDFYEHAFPAMREHGFTATMFLPTAFIADDRRSFKGTECLTWAEVREMRAACIQFGSHTVHHPKLVTLPPREIERELADSKAEIEHQLGEPAPTFAYPYAFPQGEEQFEKNLRDSLIKAGYTCCVTTELGRVKIGDDPFRLKRLPVNSLDDPELLRAKLEGGYDWLGGPQNMIKKFKSWRGSGEKVTADTGAEPRPPAEKHTMKS